MYPALHSIRLPQRPKDLITKPVSCFLLYSIFFYYGWQRLVGDSYRLECMTSSINHVLSAIGNRVSLVIPPCQRSRYATYFDVAVLRCLLQPHWSEEGTQWSLMYYLQRLRHMLEEKPEKPPEPDIPLLPRPRSSSMVAAAPSLVNTHKTQVRASRVHCFFNKQLCHNRVFFPSVHPALIYTTADCLVGGFPWYYYPFLSIFYYWSIWLFCFAKFHFAFNLPAKEVLSKCLLHTLI